MLIEGDGERVVVPVLRLGTSTDFDRGKIEWKKRPTPLYPQFVITIPDALVGVAPGPT